LERPRANQSVGERQRKNLSSKNERKKSLEKATKKQNVNI
jgi:hypothetical protein